MLSTDPEDEAWMVGMLRGSTPAERRGKHIFEQVLLFRKRRGLNHAKPPSRWRIPVFSLWLPSKATVALQPCLLRQWKAQLPQIQLLLPRQEVSESNTSCPSCEAAISVSQCPSVTALLPFWDSNTWRKPQKTQHLNLGAKSIEGKQYHLPCYDMLRLHIKDQTTYSHKKT